MPLNDLTGADDLKAIEALTGTSGTLTKTAANTWALSSGVTPASHTHGNITNDGKIGTTANQAAYTTTNGVITAGTLPAAAGGTGKTTLKDAANALINALDTGSSNLTANDYVITQYVGGGTTTTTYHRRPASALRVGGLLTARNLGVNLASTTAVTFDGTANQTNIPVSGTLPVANGGTGATAAADARTNLGLGTLATKSTISNHSVTTPTGATSRTQDVTLKNNTAATVTSAGTWPTLGTAFTIPNVTATGTASYENGILTITNTTTGTAFTVPNVTSIGTKPTFGTTTVAIDKQPTFSVTTQTTTLSHTIS